MHEWEYAFAMLLALCKEWTLDRRRVPPTSPGKNSEEQRLKVGLEPE
jgi:hypothetical protein